MDEGMQRKSPKLFRCVVVRSEGCITVESHAGLAANHNAGQQPCTPIKRRLCGDLIERVKGRCRPMSDIR